MQEFDVLIVGGGASGLRAAIAAKRSGASVALITKVHPLRTHAGVAQGGLNAPLGKDDSPQSFAADILAAGDGLCEPKVVDTFAREAAKEVLWLERMGVPFNRNSEGKMDRRLFGSNSRPRTCYADDRTGHIVLQVLHEQFLREGVSSFEEWFVNSLAMEDGACLGVTALGLRAGKLESFAARAVVLATGGFTRLYLPSTASMGTTGDGPGLAYGAGARLMDMEMVQFHPTVFPKNQALLITEAALAEGGEIVNSKGERIIETKAQPRHQLCLSIDAAIRNGGPVTLDLRPMGKEKILTRFPQTHELVRAVASLDITKEPIPIAPVAHRPMGGIETTMDGETSIRGLFAVGECAANGLNGAGRLAGNTLTEAVVFGKRVGESAARHAKSAARKSLPTAILQDQEKRLSSLGSGNSSGDSLNKIHAELGRTMHEKAGLTRDETGLKEAREEIQRLKERFERLGVRNPSRIYNYELTAHLELGSMLNLAEAVALCAQSRKESRGAHRRDDFSERDDKNWRCHTLLSWEKGAPKLTQRPVGAA